MQISKLISERIVKGEYSIDDLMTLIMRQLNDCDDDVIFDWMENHDYFQEIGYLGDLTNEVDALKENAKEIPENYPKNISMIDKEKIDFFFENMNNIEIDDLKGLV